MAVARTRRVAAATARRTVARALAEQVEHKALNTAIAAINIVSGVPQYQFLSAIPQGTDYYQRSGVDVTLRRLYMRYQVVENPLAASTTQQLRIMVLMDTQPDGALPTFVGSQGLFAAGPPTVFDQRNYVTTQRYWVMEDRVVTVSTGDQSSRYGEISQTLHARQHWIGGGASIVDVVTNAIFILLISSDAANGPAFYGAVRLWYTDM